MLSLKWQNLLDEQLKDVEPAAGLTVREFAFAMRVKPDEVWDLINEGQEPFKAKFPHCYFVQTNYGTQRIRNLIFIGNGAVEAQKIRQKEQEKNLSIVEFCRRQNLSREAVVNWLNRGHQRFRKRFPGWDFYEVFDRKGNLFKRIIKPITSFD